MNEHKIIEQYEQGKKLIKLLKSEIIMLNRLKRKCEGHGDGQGAHHYGKRSHELSAMLKRSKT